MHSNYFVIRTTSRALANQYTYILNRLGVVSSVSKNPQKDRKLCYSVTVHMGGATQLLFGIMGKRWEGPLVGGYPSLTNEHWTRPLPEERPPRYETVEGGTYW